MVKYSSTDVFEKTESTREYVTRLPFIMLLIDIHHVPDMGKCHDLGRSGRNILAAVWGGRENGRSREITSARSSRR